MSAGFPTWGSVHGGSVWHRRHVDGGLLCEPAASPAGITSRITPEDPPEGGRCKACEKAHAKALRLVSATADTQGRDEKARAMSPSDRLGEIIRQRLRVRKAAEELEKVSGEFKSAKAAKKLAQEKLEEEDRILLEIIDDKPAGPLYAGTGAGDGPIRPPEDDDSDDDDKGDHPGDIDRNHAAATTAKASRGRPKKT